jgi:hypothetical protein
MLNSFGFFRSALILAQTGFERAKGNRWFFCLCVLMEGFFLMTARKELRTVIKKKTESGKAWNQFGAPNCSTIKVDAKNVTELKHVEKISVKDERMGFFVVIFYDDIFNGVIYFLSISCNKLLNVFL